MNIFCNFFHDSDACEYAQTDSVNPLGPIPSVASKLSLGPVAFIKKSYSIFIFCPILPSCVYSPITYGLALVESPSG